MYLSVFLCNFGVCKCSKYYLRGTKLNKKLLSSSVVVLFLAFDNFDVYGHEGSSVASAVSSSGTSVTTIGSSGLKRMSVVMPSANGSTSGHPSSTDHSASSSHSMSHPYPSKDLAWFLNFKVAHERKSNRAFGPQNTSACGFNPVISVGPITFDAAFYYGRQYSNSFVFGSERTLVRTIPETTIHDFHDNFGVINKAYAKGMDKNINKPHFFREYARILYTNESNNFRVVLGDTTTHNQVGSQKAIGGAGISIFRQKGNGSVLNASSPLILTTPTKLECRLGDEILVVRVLAPGVYYIDDLPEEAKIPGVKLKLSDQLNRGENLSIDYFGGYGMLAAGEDDFDISLLFESHYDVDDPKRLHYARSPRFSGNYRIGVTDDITAGAGLQFYKTSFMLDFIAIFGTPAGKIAPHVSYCDDQSYKDNAIAVGLYYCTPPNRLGLTFEAFIGAKSRGFGDLRRSKESGEEYDKLMERYFDIGDATNGSLFQNLKTKFQHTNSATSSRQVIARITSDPILGAVTPAFTFSGLWSKSQGLREYTLSFASRIFKNVTFVVSGGITYDDPTKGVNRQSPDRRLTVALSVPIGDDIKTSLSYTHHDEERLQSYAMVEYNPSQIKGLQITAEEFFKPGYRNPAVIVKYNTNYCNIRVDQSWTNASPSSGSKSHSNRQRAFFATSLSNDGFSQYQKSSATVLRTAYEAKKVAKKKESK